MLRPPLELDEDPPVLEPLEEPAEESEPEESEPEERGCCGAGFGAGAGAGDASGSIVPTPVSEWMPRTGCSEAVGAGSWTESPVGRAALSGAPAASPSAAEVSPTEMPGRACGASSIEGSTARPIAASATATIIPRVRRIFMSSMLIATDEVAVKST